MENFLQKYIILQRGALSFFLETEICQEALLFPLQTDSTSALTCP